MEETKQMFIMGSYAAADAPGVYAFSFDAENGELKQIGAHTGIANPSFVVVHSNQKWVYAVSELGDAAGGVCALLCDKETGAFQSLNQQRSGGDYPCHLALDGTGKWLFVANYGTGNMRVFPIQSDGSLGAMTAEVQHHGAGPNKARQEGPHAHSTTLTPDNRFAIVADLGLDQLVMYALDATNGTLQEHARVATHPGAGPRHLAFHPNGRVLYVANEIDNTVAVYDYDAARGALTERQALDTLPQGVGGENKVADIHVSSAADRVYVSNRGHDSIAVFAADATGALKRVAIVPSGGKTPRNFALAPNGKFALVANQDTGDVIVLPLQKGAAEIGAPIARVAIPGVCCIQLLNHE